MTEIDTFTPREVHDALEAGEIVLIDVRTPPEYMFEHIDGALLMPMAFFDLKGLPEQGRKRIVLHCGSGSRSTQVGKSMLDGGFDRIAHMEGGMSAWKTDGLPYRGTDMNTGAPIEMKVE